MRPVDLIRIIPGTQTEALIPHAEKWIKQACEHNGEWDIPALAKGITANTMQLWVCWDVENKRSLGAGVTQIVKVGEKLVGRDVVFAGEDMKALVPLYDRIDEYFQSEGCVEGQIHTRPAIAGMLRKEHGYRDHLIIMRKAYKNEQS